MLKYSQWDKIGQFGNILVQPWGKDYLTLKGEEYFENMLQNYI